MKTLISLAAITVFLGIPCCQAIAGEPAGHVVSDTVYQDSEFGFRFSIPGTWKFQQIYHKGDIDRVVLFQNAPVVPAQFSGDMRSFFTQPQVTILACPTEKLKSHLTPKEYAEFLLNGDGKDDLKKKAYGRFVLLQMDSEYTMEPGRPRSIKIGGHHAASISGKKKYFYAFENEQRRANVQTLNDYVAGFIYVVEAVNGMLLIECACERELLDLVEPEFSKIIDSFEFEDKKDDPKGESSG